MGLFVSFLDAEITLLPATQDHLDRKHWGLDLVDVYTLQQVTCGNETIR